MTHVCMEVDACVIQSLPVFEWQLHSRRTLHVALPSTPDIQEPGRKGLHLLSCFGFTSKELHAHVDGHRQHPKNIPQ